MLGFAWIDPHLDRCAACPWSAPDRATSCRHRGSRTPRRRSAHRIAALAAHCQYKLRPDSMARCARAPIGAVGPWSNRGVQVRPALSVRQTPPPAAPNRKLSGRSGTPTTISPHPPRNGPTRRHCGSIGERRGHRGSGSMADAANSAKTGQPCATNSSRNSSLKLRRGRFAAVRADRAQAEGLISTLEASEACSALSGQVAGVVDMAARFRSRLASRRAINADLQSGESSWTCPLKHWATAPWPGTMPGQSFWMSAAQT